MAGRVGQARELVAQGRLEAAESLLLRHVQSRPGDAEAASLLSVVLMQRGDRARALYFAQRAYEAGPEDVRLLVGLGNALCVTGRVEEGTAMLRRAAELAPMDAAPRVALTRVRFESGDYTGGIQACRDAMADGIADPD